MDQVGKKTLAILPYVLGVCKKIIDLHAFFTTCSRLDTCFLGNCFDMYREFFFVVYSICYTLLTSSHVIGLKYMGFPNKKNS